MRLSLYIAAVLAMVLAAGCGNKPDEPAKATDKASDKATESAPKAAPVPPAANTEFPGTEAGAKALLGEFLKPTTDVEKLSAKLQPTEKDYTAVFIAESAKKAQAAYTPAWAAGAMQIKPKPGQTELLIWSATTEEITAWTGHAGTDFPGGYNRVGEHMNPKITVYRFKFVEPGKKIGMAYDGLVYVNGRWVIFPKPWRALGL